MHVNFHPLSAQTHTPFPLSSVFLTKGKSTLKSLDCQDEERRGRWSSRANGVFLSREKRTAEHGDKHQVHCGHDGWLLHAPV